MRFELAHLSALARAIRNHFETEKNSEVLEAAPWM
jgi:hypothetical protein